jgi:hypothetical protein
MKQKEREITENLEVTVSIDKQSENGIEERRKWLRLIKD